MQFWVRSSWVRFDSVYITNLIRLSWFRVCSFDLNEVRLNKFYNENWFENYC